MAWSGLVEFVTRNHGGVNSVSTRMLLLGLVLFMWLAGPGHAVYAFNIVVAFRGGLSPTQQAVFSDAEAFWESKIDGYLPGIVQNTVVIEARGTGIDGEGMILGQAGPRSRTKQGGFTITVSGVMFFDTADLDNLESGGQLEEVILHEMGHVLGIGTLWSANGVYSNGTGRYTGTNALAKYRSEFSQPDATFIPVELGGSAGTFNTHWDEVDTGDVLTGITDRFGRDMRDELMTGWLDSPTFVSQTTLFSLVDIGFDVVPEPSGLVLMLGGFVLSRRLVLVQGRSLVSA